VKAYEQRISQLERMLGQKEVELAVLGASGRFEVHEVRWPIPVEEMDTASTWCRVRETDQPPTSGIVAPSRNRRTGHLHGTSSVIDSGRLDKTAGLER
jgi:hypothetical protein